MAKLKTITDENSIDAFNLKLAPGQETFVSHPARSPLKYTFTEISISRSGSMRTKNDWIHVRSPLLRNG